uniref:Sugar ABC transporter ATP-binding protein n=1 Tax=Heterorhabditis bacteriophora TaxID=37862 RepID=A0A1I7WU99_HETBA
MSYQFPFMQAYYKNIVLLHLAKEYQVFSNNIKI